MTYQYFKRLVNQYSMLINQYNIIDRMQSTKNFLLPKLKSTHQPKIKTMSSHSDYTLSQKNSQNSNVKLIRNQKQGSQINKPSRSRSTNFGDGLLKIQYKYMSKSPEYFKKKQRSFQTLQPSPYEDHTPMQKFIGQKIKQFNKQSLIDLAKQGLYKNISNKHRVISKKKNPLQIYCQPIEQPSPQNETKYSTFNPPKIGPLSHSLRKVYPSIVINR